METNAVAYGCIAKTKGCTLIDKCQECTVEVNKLI